MTDCRLNVSAAVCCLAFVAWAHTASARTVPENIEPLTSEFDLSRHPRSDEGAEHRVRPDEGGRYPKDKLGPHFTYNPVRGGPTLEFGALGAGRKGMPRLAHVGVDWRF